ncbi:ribbon-helix-helix domain-containing protein [Kiloniella litopenaei]|uniref:ribbon-helix-helix domain-containing protein n=1 Tax=Kiloniella litopenaei TaxID=1549748 RepID=UPI0006988A2B|nr:ribbon-helix-helix domain-containing protein [Kiloniella litopenaei]
MTKESDNISFLSQSRRDLQKEMKRLTGKNGLVLKNVTVRGHRTSLRLEPMMWRGLNEICEREGLALNEVCNLVEGRRVQSSLTAAIRVFTLSYFRTAAQEKRGWKPIPRSQYPTISKNK